MDFVVYKELLRWVLSYWGIDVSDIASMVEFVVKVLSYWQ